jgi:hypothetical protein
MEMQPVNIDPCTEVRILMGAGAAAAVMWACNFAGEMAGDASQVMPGMQASSEGIGKIEAQLVEKLQPFSDVDGVVPFDATGEVDCTLHLHNAMMLCSAISFVIENSTLFFTHSHVDTEDRKPMLAALKLGMKAATTTVGQTFQLAAVGPPGEGEVQH